MNKRHIVEIAGTAKNDRRVLLTQCFFKGTPGHRHIAEGNQVAGGEMAAQAALRLYNREDGPSTEPKVRAHYWVDGEDITFDAILTSPDVLVGERLYFRGQAYVVESIIHDEMFVRLA